jgi:hypothetical protein
MIPLSRTPVAAALAAALTAPPAAAREPGPMTIGLVRPSGAACGAPCPAVIALQGVVRPDSHRRLKVLLDGLGARRPLVVVNSPGGNVDAALAMGRAIRAAGLDVAVARLAPQQPIAFDGAICSSACTLILAGGLARLAAPEARMGVHSMAQTETERVVERVYRRSGENGGREIVSERVISQRSRPLDAPPEVANRGVAEHFAALGLGPSLAAWTLATPPDRIRLLTREERRASGLVTQDEGLAEALRR